MSPEEFIKKHISDALLREGFPAEVVMGGGQSVALIITVAALRPPVRGACLLIVFSAPVSGLSDQTTVAERSAGKKPAQRKGQSSLF